MHIGRSIIPEGFKPSVKTVVALKSMAVVTRVNAFYKAMDGKKISADLQWKFADILEQAHSNADFAHQFGHKFIPDEDIPF